MIEVKDLLNSVHFGHLTKNGIQIWHHSFTWSAMVSTSLTSTKPLKLEEATKALGKIAASGRKILFVATKKQAKDIVAEQAANVNTLTAGNWPIGSYLLTSVRRLKKWPLWSMKKDGTFNTLKERTSSSRSFKSKIRRNLGSISDMTRLPGALCCRHQKRTYQRSTKIEYSNFCNS